MLPLLNLRTERDTVHEPNQTVAVNVNMRVVLANKKSVRRGDLSRNHSEMTHHVLESVGEVSDVGAVPLRHPVRATMLRHDRRDAHGVCDTARGALELVSALVPPK